MDIKQNDNYNLEQSLQNLFDYVKTENGFLTQDLSDVKNALKDMSSDGHKEIVEQIITIIKNKLV